MDFDIAAFRANFPEFKDATKYPNTQITFWSGVAAKQVLESVWDDQWNVGVSLYTAHELVLSAQNEQASRFGGSPGQQGGIANNKTVGSTTVSYDSQSSTEKDAGYWNLTTYGKQFIRLVRIFGAGAIQL